MKYLRIDFNESCYLDCYLHEYYKWDIVGKVNESHPALIVCPGGGFSSISCSEAEPVALTFMQEGFSTFVLNYSTEEKCTWDNAIREVLRAIWEVRSHAEEWYINPDAIGIIGFSAGGGMAGIASTQWNTPDLYKELGAPTEEALKPNAALLCYGVMDATRLIIEKNALSGGVFGNPPGVPEPRFDAINYVDKHTPPTFLLHGRRDSVITSDATLDYAKKLEEFDIPYELHTFDFAGHGFTVLNRTTDSDNYDARLYKNISLWVKMAANWMMNTFGY